VLTDSLTVDLLAEHVRGEGAPDRPTPTEWAFPHRAADGISLRAV